MNQIVISANNLTKAFSGKEVIQNCTFSVEQGSIYGFLGRNGAGKTTMLKLLLGLLKPSAGTASVLGLDSVRDNKAILRRTGSLIETPIFYEHLSAADNLLLPKYFCAVVPNLTPSERFWELFNQVSQHHPKPVDINLHQIPAICAVFR